MVSTIGAVILIAQESPDLGQGQAFNIADIWASGGFMMWPLGLCLAIGIAIIIWKFFNLNVKAAQNRSLLKEVDELVAGGRLSEALGVCENSASPAGRILAAGLQRHDEGTDRVTAAIEHAGAVQVAELERGLVWLATLSNVAPLLGFLGTVIGMIQAFQAIEIAGEVEATLVAGGIKVALITTATGLTIAIPINIMHNYFVSKVDRMVIDMEESAQKMIDAVHARDRGAAI